MIEAELPDGTILEFPEGTDRSVIQSVVRKRLGVGDKPSLPPLSAGERFTKGGKDALDAGAQMLTRVLPGGVVDAINSATKAANETPYIGPVTKALGMVPATKDQIDADIKSSEAEYQARRGDRGIDWWRLGGNVTAAIPVGAVAGPSLPGALAGGAATGVLQPVTNTEDFTTEKIKQAGIGAAAGVAGNLVGRGVSRMLAPKTDPAVKDLMARGVTPTPGQALGGAFKTAEEKLTSVPLLGDTIKAGQRRSIESFNKAVYDEVLAPIGQKAPKEMGRTAVASVADKIDEAYQSVLPKLTFRADQQLADDLANLASLTKELPEKEAKTFTAILNDKLAKALGPQGVMDGRSFKEIESSLTRNISLFKKSGDAYQQQLGDALLEMRRILREGLARSNTSVTVEVAGKSVNAAEHLGNINKSYAMLTRLENAAGRANEGVFTPNQFSQAVKSMDQSIRKRAYSRGDAMMQQLSDEGRAVLGNVYPDSGTVGRALLTLALGGTGMVNAPVAAAGGLLALPYMTGMGQRITAGLLAGQRPELLTQLEPAIRAGLPYFSTGLAGVAAGQR